MDKTTIVFAGEIPSQTLSDLVASGRATRLATGIYSTDTDTSPERIVSHNWNVIVGRAFPNAVITDRSAITGGPTNGILYLAHDARDRSLELPGLTVLARRGAGPMDGDTPLPGGLHIASKGRAIAENTRPSRGRSGRVGRTLDGHELADWVDHLARVDGEERLQRHRVQAETIGPVVGASERGLDHARQLIGGALGTQQVATGSAALKARQRGAPYDQNRIERFDRLILALRGAAPQHRPVDHGHASAYETTAFYEAYFSNYIEGTEFTLPDARALVYDGITPEGRNKDAHDLVGTYRIVADRNEMAEHVDEGADYLELIRRRHAFVMAGRPDTNLGEFKRRPNQAGNTLFVSPELVHGTLIEGFRRLDQLDTAWERASYSMFLIAEVHPFDDGNGRMARIMMNAELVRGGQSKIIVPTVFRNDYLTALRQLSNRDDPSVLVKTLRYLHDYTSQIEWRDRIQAEQDLRSTNAFEPPADGYRLTLLRPLEAPFEAS